MIRTLFTRKWLLPSLLVIAALGVMIRLGIWQLDRLEQRRIFNAHYQEQIAAPTLSLTSAAIDLNLKEMEYRQIEVTGEYDHVYEMAIRNQSWGDQPGVRLLTPLMIEETQMAVLVDRGWIPLDAYQTGNWEAFHATGVILVSGIIRLNQEPTFGGRPDPTPQPGETITALNFVNIENISKQIPYKLVPIYIQLLPDPAWTDLPYRSTPEIEISEGPHLSYALQWFIFTLILGIGYPVFVLKEIQKQMPEIIP